MDGSDGRCGGREGSRPATTERGESVRLSLLRHIYRLRFIFHSQSLHWSDHRQFQHAKEKGERRSGEILIFLNIIPFSFLRLVRTNSFLF